MVKIAFFSDHLNERGTSQAIFDYAHYNETLLGNKSIIITLKHSSYHEDLAIDKFKNRFALFFCDKIEDCQDFLKDCDIFYCIKYGKNNYRLPLKIKNVVHCVFDMSEPHGDVYAGVSESLAKKFNNTLFVPHMISLIPSVNKDDNLRTILNIPENAVVFGRHGGQDTFNIQFVIDVITNNIVKMYPNIYFVFVNTPIFIHHPNVIFLNKIMANEEKNQFINTCDAHLECGTLGHSFGISIGEFSVNNKPIIAYGGETWNNAHKDILGNKAIYFYDSIDFYNILSTFDPIEYKNKDLNCYKEYTPEKVMKKFKEVFIDTKMSL